ncbi:MAG: hypothetical protein K2Y32_09045 [Candidatus Obscuribacterales bacterium]|nr:hypothetical protein [Candidatus Obscuribacterales bacterium]
MKRDSKEETKARIHAIVDLEAYRSRRQELLSNFNKAFPDDSACWTAVISELKEAGFLDCRRCYCSNIEISKTFRTFVCLECKKKHQLTAGTYFHGVRRIRAWLFAIWTIDQSFYVSSNWLSKALCLSQSASLHILKTALVVVERSQSELLKDTIPTIKLRNFFDKRSLLTAANTKPKEELTAEEPKSSEHEQKESKRDSESRTEKKTKTPETKTKTKREKNTYNKKKGNNWDQTAPSSGNALQKRIQNILRSADKTVDELIEELEQSSRDVLSSLTELEFEGIVICKAGGKIALAQAKVEQESLALEIVPATEIRMAKKKDAVFTDSSDTALVFRIIAKRRLVGLSRKYMSLYLSASAEIVTATSSARMLSSCIANGYIGSRYLKRYCSGQTLSFAKTNTVYCK